MSHPELRRSATRVVVSRDLATERANRDQRVGSSPGSRLRGAPRDLALSLADWQCLLAVAIPLAVYTATLAPSITWRHGGADSGELAAAVARGAVPHPPGYPLYLLLGRLAYLTFPLAEPAARLNLLSALCVALAAGLL